MPGRYRDRNLWDPAPRRPVSGLDEQTQAADGVRRAVLFDLDAAGSVTVFLDAGRG